MAGYYRIMRNSNSSNLYNINSVMLLVGFVSLIVQVFSSDVEKKILILVLPALVLIVYFLIVYADMILFLDNYVVLIFAPLFIFRVVSYNNINVIDDANIKTSKGQKHFLIEKDAINVCIQGNVYTFTTENNDEIKYLIKTGQSKSIRKHR